MFKTLKGIFGRTNTLVEQKKDEAVLVNELVDDYEEKIPRYPPFAKGLPVASIDKVVATQDELVKRVRTALGFNEEQYLELILPVIHRYAEFVHLLPASEAHHHRGAGGLFRHGLEVAFWAAQASESVIFSIEGSPRERRNNEPRWRLASCFSGLLHDAGKPLSDVSVTNKDGSVIWNPYANTLFRWASHHKVDRYFLRWRDNRHKRHEQFSLLAIERIIPSHVLQYLSEAGPEILEAMLEAVAGTEINQPLTKLMLKADQESVSRDLKQNRLNVDEYAYGVPVERYVFDSIRRLIKTRKWKVNEIGARVWHLNQGVFITWRELGDLYELIEKDKIPGIPRDPDTLGDILIERGFAIPNEVRTSKGDGESAHYRYWEICPEILQEGRPNGSVKLLCLRLESHDLIFTTEPPTQVKAVIAGEKEEPEIEHENVDSKVDDQEMPKEVASVEEGDSKTEDEENQVKEPQSQEPQPGLENAYEIAESIPEIGADGANPLNGLMVDGEMDFPFSAFGMEQPSLETPADPKTSKECSHYADKCAEPVLDVSNLFPSNRSKGVLSGNATKTTNKNVSAKSKILKVKEPSKPSVLENTPSSLNVSTKQSRDKLTAALKELPAKAQKILEKAILPVLSGEKLLGDVLCMFQKQVAILYPEGANTLGNATEILASLWDAGVVVGDPITPGKKIQTFKGMKGVVLEQGISSLVIDALNEFESSMEGIRSVFIDSDEKQKNKKIPKAGDLNTRVSKKNHTEPLQPKQNSTSVRRLEKTVKTSVKSEIPPPIDSESRPSKKEVDIPEINEKRQMAEAFDDINPKEMSAEIAIAQLKEMIIKREGRWITGAVTREERFLVTSGKSLDMIASELVSLSKHNLRAHLKRGQADPPMMYKQGKLYLVIKDNEA